MVERGEFDSLELEPDEFRELGHRAVELMADHFDRVSVVDTLPDTTPSDLAEIFDEPIPREGQPPESILSEWENRVYPHASHQGSPRWYGYVQGSGSPIGVIADALAAAVNNNVFNWVCSPSATEVERQSIRWLADMIGYPSECGGLLTSGGTLANYSAIYAALQSATGFDVKEGGLRGLDISGRFRLYHQDHEGHSSIERVVEMLGLGTNSIRTVPSTDDYRIDTGKLEEMITRDAAAGDIPFCIVAYAGSINVSAIDPLDEIASVSAHHDVWMHVDGACGAVGALLPEKEHLYEGLDRADSVTIDPHKWLGIPFSCGCILFRDRRIQARTFAMDAAYLDQMEDERYHGTSFGYLGPEMTRPFRGLKLWMSIKHRGLEGYQRLLRQGCHCAEHLHARVSEADDFEVVQEPNLFIYSFRYRPEDLAGTPTEPQTDRAVPEYLDWLNQRIADEIRLTGQAFLTTTEVRDRTVLRLSICSHRTKPSDIDDTFEMSRKQGEEIDATNRDRLRT